MTGTTLPGIRKALSDALTSEAFLEEAGITRAAAEEAMALCRWEEALPTLFPVTGRYTCRQLFDLSPTASSAIFFTRRRTSRSPRRLTGPARSCT